MSQSGIANLTSAVPTIPINFVTDSGTAIAAANTIDVLGGAGITTSALGNVITVAQSPDPLDVQHGGTGRASLTNHGVLVGASTNPITQLSAGSTGQVLQSGGASADPAYSTATYPSTASGTGTLLRADGTNWTATTSTYPSTNAINTLLYASSANVMSALTTANNGTLVTSSAGIPSILAGPGTTGNILQSNAAAAPSFSTATYPSTAGTSGKILISDGTNIISSTPTFPNASATSRKIIVSDGTNWVASTETWGVPGTSGQLLTSNGTNWVSTAPTIAVATLALTNAQCKALNTTPVTILAAQGSGIVINVLNIITKFSYGGTNAFTGGGALGVRYQNGTGQAINVNIFTAASLTGTASLYTINNITSIATGTAIANFQNQPVVAHMATANLAGNAANNNTISIQIAYTLVSI